MALTMTPERFEEIRRRVREHQTAEETVRTDWDKQPAFTSVDEFLAYLEHQPTPQGRPQRRNRHQRS